MQFPNKLYKAKEGFLLPQESLVIFVVATTGQGDPPENMKVIVQRCARTDEQVLNDCSIDACFRYAGDSCCDAICPRRHCRT